MRLISSLAVLSLPCWGRHGASATGIILGPNDPAPPTGDYIRLLTGQREHMIFDPMLLYNDTFLNRLLDKQFSSSSPLRMRRDPASSSSPPDLSAGAAKTRRRNPDVADRILGYLGGGRLPAASGTLGKRANDFVCNGVGPWATQVGAGRCAGTLLGLGNSSSCGTGPGEPKVVCDVREQGVRTVVRSLTLSGVNQSVRCVDAAFGVEWVVRNCGRQERCETKAVNGTDERLCYLGGAGAAQGNPNVVMYLYGDSPGLGA